MNRALFTCTSFALALAGCGADVAPRFVELTTSPSRITLLGPGHARDLDVFGRTTDGALEAVALDALSLTPDEAIVTTRGARILAQGTGTAIVRVRAGGAEVELAVDVLDLPRPFAQSVVSVERGAGDGFGRSSLPGVVLGPPKGAGARQGGTDVLSLGVGGAIVLGLAPLTLYDGPGPDLLVFENAFEIASGAGTYAEPAEVSVALGASDFAAFSCDASGAPWSGCAGVAPVIAGPGAPDVDPTDPVRAGGDAFDLAALGDARSLADLVRIQDVATGTITGIGSGFDLDAIALVHVLPADVVGLGVEGAVASLTAGGSAPLPTFFGVRADGSRVWGVRAQLTSTPEGVVALDGARVRGVVPGRAVLHAKAGPLSTTL
ncbi:hypothetical protein L6R52_43245, partial [Myxococcota bacterium]|nr:hypothetical protein [Myxococcota bacterium]